MTKPDYDPHELKIFCINLSLRSTLNTGNYDLNTDAGTELLETDLEELKQKAIAQRKKWEKACFIYEEAQAPQYTCKRKERLNDEAAVLEDIAPMAGKGIASKPLPIMDGSNSFILRYLSCTRQGVEVDWSLTWCLSTRYTSYARRAAVPEIQR